MKGWHPVQAVLSPHTRDIGIVATEDLGSSEVVEALYYL